MRTGKGIDRTCEDLRKDPAPVEDVPAVKKTPTKEKRPLGVAKKATTKVAIPDPAPTTPRKKQPAGNVSAAPNA